MANSVDREEKPSRSINEIVQELIDMGMSEKIASLVNYIEKKGDCFNLHKSVYEHMFYKQIPAINGYSYRILDNRSPASKLLPYINELVELHLQNNQGYDFFGITIFREQAEKAFHDKKLNTEELKHAHQLADDAQSVFTRIKELGDELKDAVNRQSQPRSIQEIAKEITDTIQLYIGENMTQKLNEYIDKHELFVNLPIMNENKEKLDAHLFASPLQKLIGSAELVTINPFKQDYQKKLLKILEDISDHQLLRRTTNNQEHTFTGIVLLEETINEAFNQKKINAAEKEQGNEIITFLAATFDKLKTLGEELKVAVTRQQSQDSRAR